MQQTAIALSLTASSARGLLRRPRAHTMTSGRPCRKVRAEAVLQEGRQVDPVAAEALVDTMLPEAGRGSEGVPVASEPVSALPTSAVPPRTVSGPFSSRASWALISSPQT